VSIGARDLALFVRPPGCREIAEIFDGLTRPGA